MSATPFADHRTTAGDTFGGQSRIIYFLCFSTPSYTLRMTIHTNGTHVYANEHNGALVHMHIHFSYLDTLE